MHSAILIHNIQSSVHMRDSDESHHISVLLHVRELLGEIIFLVPEHLLPGLFFIEAVNLSIATKQRITHAIGIITKGPLDFVKLIVRIIFARRINSFLRVVAA